MVRLHNHINCCGVRHLINFGGVWPNQNTVTSEIHLDRALADLPLRTGAKQRGKLVEAIVTDSQFKAQPQLAKMLKDRGFKIVSRFHNSTGGMCNVLHRVSGARDIKRASSRLSFIKELM